MADIDVYAQRKDNDAYYGVSLVQGSGTIIIGEYLNPAAKLRYQEAMRNARLTFGY